MIPATTIYLIPVILMGTLCMVTVNKWQKGGSHWLLAATVSSLISMAGFTWEIMKGMTL